jgi:hypothetical protein
MCSPNFKAFFHSLLTSIFFIGCKGNPLDLGLTEESGAMNVMHLFTSPDFTEWTHQGPVSWGITSLGLHKRKDGKLAITCIQEVRPPTWWEQRSPKVYGYIYDGETFTATEWDITDEGSSIYIDPQLFEEQMWYISPSGYTGDPAKAPATPIRSSEPGIERYKAPKIADPSPVRFNKELHVFATQNGSIVHLIDKPLRPIALSPETNSHFNGSTVPFATFYGESLMLVAQRHINGRRIPVYSLSSDGNNWGNWVPLANIPQNIPACSSPVVGENPKGGWIMLCIEEKRK